MYIFIVSLISLIIIAGSFYGGYRYKEYKVSQIPDKTSVFLQHLDSLRDKSEVRIRRESELLAQTLKKGL